MDLSKIGSALKTGDNILRNVVPIAEQVTNKIRSGIGMGSWGYEAMLTTPISSYCMIDMANWQLYKHMYINWAERGITLDMVGDSASGISNKVSDEVYKYYHTYNDGNNYIEDYQRDAKFTTTRAHDNVDKKTHNYNYGTNVNVYPDEDNTGNNKFTENKKWNYYDANRNRNSIIAKTKQLFDERKINTIVSRFHTDPTNSDLYDDTEARTEYGLSHGRNLLTYDAEHNGRSYDRNGYDNPYCRVWTHHHQYSELRARLMRPFTIEDENGNVTSGTNQEFHKWDGFPNMEYATKEKKVQWGWKDKGADGWAKSVLNRDTGLVNITPKYLGGAEKNIHTKDCMFSIENLAWQGYDPYSFEKALSWEQRGPFGGRIMWFPPYGLRFSEDSSVNWNEHSFIGRGENVFTYTNTSRTGTLEFMMVVDHPSILDYSTWYGGGMESNDNLPKDTDIYRFFAGCDGGGISRDNSANGGSGGNQGGGGGLTSYVKPTPLTDEYLMQDNSEAIDVTENEKPEPPTPPQKEEEPIPTPDEEIVLSFYVFFPNNYSGYYDYQSGSKVNPIAYLLCGKGAQWNCKEDDVTKAEVLPIDFNGISQGDFLGNGYEMANSRSNKTEQDRDKNYIIGTSPNWRYYKASKYVQYNNKKWYYRTDGEYKIATGNEQYKNTFDQTLRTAASYLDGKTLGLNYNVDAVKTQFPEEKDNENLYSLAEIAYALLNNYEGDEDTPDQTTIVSRTNGINKSDERIKNLIDMLDTRESSVYKVVELHGVGYSNSHGSNAVKEINAKRNDFLAEQRCVTVLRWFKENYGKGGTTIQSGSEISKPGVPVDNKDLQDESGDSAKRWRSAKITIKINKSAIVEPKDMNQEPSEELKFISAEDYDNLTPEEKAKCTPSQYRYVGSELIWKQTLSRTEYLKNCEGGYIDGDFPCEDYEVSQYSMPDTSESGSEEQTEEVYKRFTGFDEREIKDGVQLYVNSNEEDPEKKERRWYYDEETKQMKIWNEGVQKTRRSSYNWKSTYGNDFNQTEETNSLRYDQEYHFFKQLEATHPDVFDTLVQKLQYFDPAFHSMTPEGFMGRLNFLQQCTRQGATISASDENGHSANNLAFGRPPFCILRLGDFYYQKIVIRNINITYDPLVLDLNNEGVGVVPLIANVTISFSFIGGGDLSGPVRRLQNAMSFNYYANGRLYDNRADRVEREKTQWDTMGAMGHHKVDFDESYFHKVQMAK